MSKNNMPELRFKTMPKTLIKMRKNITEISYGFLFEGTPLASNLLLKSFHNRVKSDDNKKSKTPLHSFTPDPYVISFKSEIKQALQYLKKSPVINETIKIERLPTLRYRNRDEVSVKNFIEAIFTNEQNVYRKSLVNADANNVDVVAAEKILQEAKKIIKHGIKKKIVNEALGNKIEYFWNQFISKDKIVRWDIFEDHFVSYISSYMVIDFGIIRKINWKVFMRAMFKRIGKESIDNSMWIASPSFRELPEICHNVINVKDFSTFMSSQDAVKMLYG